MSGLKNCSICGEEKPLSEFYPHKKGGQGVASRCRLCCRDYFKQRNRQDRETDRNREINQLINWRV